MSRPGLLVVAVSILFGGTRGRWSTSAAPVEDSVAFRGEYDVVPEEFLDVDELMAPIGEDYSSLMESESSTLQFADEYQGLLEVELRRFGEDPEYAGHVDYGDDQLEQVTKAYITMNMDYSESQSPGFEETFKSNLASLLGGTSSDIISLEFYPGSTIAVVEFSEDKQTELLASFETKTVKQFSTALHVDVISTTVQETTEYGGEVVPSPSSSQYNTNVGDSSSTGSGGDQASGSDSDYSDSESQEIIAVYVSMNLDFSETSTPGFRQNFIDGFTKTIGASPDDVKSVEFFPGSVIAVVEFVEDKQSTLIAATHAKTPQDFSENLGIDVNEVRVESIPEESSSPEYGGSVDFSQMEETATQTGSSESFFEEFPVKDGQNQHQQHHQHHHKQQHQKQKTRGMNRNRNKYLTKLQRMQVDEAN